MGSVDDFELRDIETVLRRNRLDLGDGAYQDRLDDTGGGSFAGTPQRQFVAGVHHEVTAAGTCLAAAIT